MKKHSVAVLFLACALWMASGATAYDVTPPSKYRGLVLSVAQPDYPIEARRRYVSGRGIADLEVP